jgi:hypothetical protein
MWTCLKIGSMESRLKVRDMSLPFVQNILQGRSAQIFQKSRSYLKILGARRVTWSKFHSEEPQILGAMVQNLVAWATWHQGFMYPCGWIRQYCLVHPHVNNRSPVHSRPGIHCEIAYSLTIFYTFYTFLTCTYIVCSVCVIHTVTWIPDDDPRRDQNMLD